MSQGQSLSRLKLWRAKKIGNDVSARGRIWLHGGGTLILGDRVLLNGSDCGIELHVLRGARLVIGDDVVIGPGVSIEATHAVHIGRGVKIGAYCKILDNHWHKLRGDRTVQPEASPVFIGDGAVLERNVIVLPGARIGANSTLIAETVVARAVPDGAVISGYPARVVKDPKKKEDVCRA